MRAVSHDLDRIRVQLVIRDGFGRIIEDGRNVVLGLNVRRDGWGVGLKNRAVLDITLKDL
jgi:hypothetical protein